MVIPNQMEESFSQIIFSDPNVEFNVNQKSAITNINDFIYSSGKIFVF